MLLRQISGTALYLLVFSYALIFLFAKDANVFSRSGELKQVENARKSAMKGSSVLCAKSADGDVVMCIPAPPKKLSNALIDRRSADKVSKISDDTWATFAGVAGDARLLTKSCRMFCIDYFSQFGVQPSVRSIAKHIGEVQHRQTMSGDGRPLGVQSLLIGKDHTSRGWLIYLSDPSGEMTTWKAHAIGINSVKYIERLEQGWSESLSTIDVAKLLQKIAGGRKEVKLTGKSSVGEMESAEQKPANADSDVAADGVNSLADPDSDSFDFYLFRTESDGSEVRDERSFLTYHSTIEKLIAAVEKRNQEKDEPTFSAS